MAAADRSRARFLTICARGLESVVADELRALGSVVLEERRAAVLAEGGLRDAYAAVVRCRAASRVVLPVASFAAPDPDALYEGARAVPWLDHLGPESTLAVDFGSSRSAITDARFGALRVKDAIVDRIRAQAGARPSIDTRRPDVRIHVHVHEDAATVSIDLAGQGLHRRGYRTPGAEAPLRESLAAGMLLLAGWPARAEAGAPFLDPMCGSGTLPIEAALIAANVAPGVLRGDAGPVGWLGHDPKLFAAVLAEARAAERRDAPLPPIEGADEDGDALRLARTHADRAGVAMAIRLERRPIAATPVRTGEDGLMVANPPYGERLQPGEQAALGNLYETIGDVMKQRLGGWTGWVLAGSPSLAKRIGLKPAAKHALFNGAIECRFLSFPINPAAPASDRGPRWRRPSPHAEMLANRIAKRVKHLARWARREEVTCYRVYDADLPEYAVAIDRYEGTAEGDAEPILAAVVQEYAPPAEIEPERADANLRDVIAVVPGALGAAPERVFLKVRRRHGRTSQYDRVADTGAELIVREGGHRFLVNLSDYLDTGLFLDQRRVRARLAELAPDRRFLNLFAYTATATVYAAAAGARSTTSVDMSNTYLAWAERNFALNGMGGLRHRTIRADVLAWLPHERERQYDLIFVSPPTFSSGKKMAGTFDVQRDHPGLLRDCAAVLAPGGTILFSTHVRRFALDEEALARVGLRASDVSERMVPPDFERKRPHRTWEISAAGPPPRAPARGRDRAR